MAQSVNHFSYGKSEAQKLKDRLTSEKGKIFNTINFHPLDPDGEYWKEPSMKLVKQCVFISRQGKNTKTAIERNFVTFSVSMSTQVRHKLVTESQFMCQYGILSGS
jgi:hypothetical protein